MVSDFFFSLKFPFNTHHHKYTKMLLWRKKYSLFPATFTFTQMSGKPQIENHWQDRRAGGVVVVWDECFFLHGHQRRGCCKSRETSMGGVVDDGGHPNCAEGWTTAFWAWWAKQSKRMMNISRPAMCRRNSGSCLIRKTFICWLVAGHVWRATRLMVIVRFGDQPL